MQIYFQAFIVICSEISVVFFARRGAIQLLTLKLSLRGRNLFGSFWKIRLFISLWETFYSKWYSYNNVCLVHFLSSRKWKGLAGALQTDPSNPCALLSLSFKLLFRSACIIRKIKSFTLFGSYLLIPHNSVCLLIYLLFTLALGVMSLYDLNM